MLLAYACATKEGDRQESAVPPDLHDLKGAPLPRDKKLAGTFDAALREALTDAARTTAQYLDDGSRRMFEGKCVMNHTDLQAPKVVGVTIWTSREKDKGSEWLLTFIETAAEYRLCGVKQVF